MAVTEAQAALWSIAFELVRLQERRREVLEALPRSENEDAMLVGEISWASRPSC